MSVTVSGGGGTGNGPAIPLDAGEAPGDPPRVGAPAQVEVRKDPNHADSVIERIGSHRHVCGARKGPLAERGPGSPERAEAQAEAPSGFSR